MPASQANLSHVAGYPDRAWDYIVVWTQKALNARLHDCLDDAGSTLTLCWVADQSNNPKLFDHDALVQQAGGEDPFLIPDGLFPVENPPKTSGLFAQNFLCAIRAEIGDPMMSDLSKTPDVVTFEQNNRAQFSLLCNSFQLVSPAGLPPYKQPWTGWINQSQQQDMPWVMSAEGTCPQMTSVPGETNYPFLQLPAPAQVSVKNMKDSAFSMQQILYLLGNAGLADAFSMIFESSYPDPNSQTHLYLQSFFIDTYCRQLAGHGLPYLGIEPADLSNSPTSTAGLRDVTVAIASYNGAMGDYSTLEFRCMQPNGYSQPGSATQPFPWTWIDGDDIEQMDGLLCLNSFDFSSYIYTQLLSYYQPIALYYLGSDGWGNNISSNNIEQTQTDQLFNTVVYLTFDTRKNYSYVNLTWQNEWSMTRTDAGFTTSQRLLVKANLISGDLVWKDKSIYDTTFTHQWSMGVNSGEDTHGNYFGNLTATLVSWQSADASNLDWGNAVNSVPDLSDLFSRMRGLVNIYATAGDSASGFQTTLRSAFENYILPGKSDYIYSMPSFSSGLDLIVRFHLRANYMTSLIKEIAAEVKEGDGDVDSMVAKALERPENAAIDTPQDAQVLEVKVRALLLKRREIRSQAK